MAHTDGGNHATEIGTNMIPTEHNPYPTIRGVNGKPFDPEETFRTVKARMDKFYAWIDGVEQDHPASPPV